MLFNSVVGHSKQLSSIKSLVDKGLFPQTSLFTGPFGVGKRLVATELLNYLTKNPLNLKKLGEVNPLTIEEVRELKEWLYTQPKEGEGKGVLIDNAEEMRREAVNALLKTLEEPPNYAYIVLISSNEASLLPTIRSRCRTFRFGRLSDANVEFVLEKLKVNYDKKVIKVARGSPGLALKLIERGIVELLSEFVNLLKDKRRIYRITQISSLFSGITREDALLFIDAFENLLVQNGQITNWGEVISKARNFLKYYGKPQSVIEWMLIEKLVNSSLLR